MCWIVTVSLSSLDLFICLASVSSSPPPFHLSILSPWQSIWWFHPSPADCLLSPSSPSFSPMLFTLPLPQTLAALAWFFCLLVSRPLRTPLSQQSCQIKITSFKKFSQHYPPTNSEGPPCWLFMYSGVHCIMAEMHSDARHGSSIKIWCIHS